MPSDITMPQLTDTMTEGTLVKWNKKEGDKVKAGEEVADVETDKATMPMEAFDGGTLAVILAKEGDKVKVGERMGVIALAGESVEDVKKKYGGASGGATASGAAPSPGAQQPAEAKAPAARQTAETRQAGAASAKAKAAAASPGHERVPPPAAHHGSVATFEGASMGEMHEPDEVGHHATRENISTEPPHGDAGGNGDGDGNGRPRLRASPLAKRVAAEKGVDLGQVQGSGPGGRIIQRDVLAFLERPAPAKESKPGTAPAPPAMPARVARGEKEVIPLTKMRQAIAAALQRSKQSIPHFYETVDIDVEELTGLRARLNKQLEAEGVKISVADFVAKAVAAALLKHPAVNAHFSAERKEITRFGDVNLGLAVAIPDGLIVPVLRGVDQMGLKEIRVRSAELIKRAQAQRLKQDEMRGATFTISNLGTYGVREFSAIVNPPEVAILAVATAERRPVVRADGQIVARTMMTVTLSADHRAVDGATAAEFLRTLKGMLEEPGMMLV